MLQGAPRHYLSAGAHNSTGPGVKSHQLYPFFEGHLQGLEVINSIYKEKGPTLWWHLMNLSDQQTSNCLEIQLHHQGVTTYHPNNYSQIMKYMQS